jgi:hypothetical protein
MTTTDFERLQKKIADKKTERDQKIGQRNQLLTQLKDEFDCDDIDQAKAKLDELEKKLTELQTNIDAKQKYIEETYADLIA